MEFSEVMQNLTIGIAGGDFFKHHSFSCILRIK